MPNKPRQPLDPRRSAESVAKRHRTLAARRYPLFAATGTLDQVVPPVTADQVLEKRARGQAAAAAAEVEGRARARVALAGYQAAYADLGGDVAAAAACCAQECQPYAVRFKVNPPAVVELTASDLDYQVNWWNRAIARLTGLSPLEVFNRYRRFPTAAPTGCGQGPVGDG